jgi:two-component system response regulator AgrA
MLNIFICEDDPVYKKQITECIEKYIFMEGLVDIKLALSTDTPYGILGYIIENKSDGLYFLDVDLNCDIDGITLAEKIRQYDPRGFIVFITMHGETLQLTFKYKVEAMDFILKSSQDLNAQICECIRIARKKYNSILSLSPSDYNEFVFKHSNGGLLSLNFANILYFETSSNKSHRIIAYSENSVQDFHGSLSDIEKQTDKTFFRCHKSIVVNLKKVINIDTKQRILTLEHGFTCLISSRKIGKLKSFLRDLNASNDTHS